MTLPGTSGAGSSQPPQRPKISLGAKPGLIAGPKTPPKIQVMVQGDQVAVVTILDSHILDESNINEIGRQLMDLVKKQYMIKMVIDMGAVKYLSSAVLRQFIALYKSIKAEKGDLKLCRVRAEIREVFKITQLDKMIEIHDELLGAVNSFKKKGWGFLQR